MKCNELEVYGLDYLDGTLGRQEREAVELHLSACAACAERVRGFREVNRLLDAWEGIQPSPSFSARLQQRILAQPSASHRWLDWLALPFLQRPYAKPALAGIVLGMLLAAVALVRYFPSTPADLTAPQAPRMVATISDGTDELALYQDLAVLEDWELLTNFEVLQELNRTTP
jgi:anti-sigma factor RsiW